MNSREIIATAREVIALDEQKIVENEIEQPKKSANGKCLNVFTSFDLILLSLLFQWNAMREKRMRGMSECGRD